MAYLDPRGAKLCIAKFCGGSTVKMCDATDGSSPAAVVEGLQAGTTWKGKCTFAKGADPIIAIIMAVEYMAFTAG